MNICQILLSHSSDVCIGIHHTHMYIYMYTYIHIHLYCIHEDIWNPSFEFPVFFRLGEKTLQLSRNNSVVKYSVNHIYKYRFCNQTFCTSWIYFDDLSTISTHTHKCAHTHAHTYTHAHTRTDARRHTHTHTHTRTRTHTHAHAHTHTQAHTHTHTHTQTRTQTHTRGQEIV